MRQRLSYAKNKEKNSPVRNAIRRGEVVVNTDLRKRKDRGRKCAGQKGAETGEASRGTGTGAVGHSATVSTSGHDGSADFARRCVRLEMRSSGDASTAIALGMGS